MTTNATHPIVVGVDGSAAALRAVRWAATEARERGRGLRLVHAFDDVALSYPRPMPTHEDLYEVLRSRGLRFLREARDAATEIAPDLVPTLELGHQRVAEALREESKTASLLVLGTESIRPLGRALIGSVSIALAAHAHCPVALVRPHAGEETAPTEGPVVVGVDSSDGSSAALGVAFEEALWRKAPLVAAHTWDDAFVAAIYQQTHWNLDRPTVEKHEHEALAQLLAPWREEYPDVEVEQVVERGRPADGLLERADHAQLLVVGSRGRGGLAGMLLGSTSQTVMSYALCPIVVARAPRAQH